MNRLDRPKYVRAGPIYPIPVKPPSGINDWTGWPDDVVRLLKAWNTGHGETGHRLSFRQTQSGSIFDVYLSVFKCTRCALFCKPHPSGIAQLDGDWYCDDCLIELAREEL